MYANFQKNLVVAALLGSILGLASCASNPATGGVDLVMMSEKKEIELGKEQHQQVLKTMRPYRDEQLQAYINEVGQRLAAVSERSDLDFTFTLVDDDAVNAFALPGGYVYVTRGMLAYLNSEAELAAVLGHEIGHITGRHAVRLDSRSKLVDATTTIVGVSTGVPGATNVSDMFGGALISGYGRAMELEADSLAGRYLAKTNYPPQAMIEVVDILKRRELFEIERARIEGREPKVYHGWYASHPDADTRLEEAIEEAEKLGTGNPDMIRRELFLRNINGVRYGKNPAGGVIRGNRFYHAGLRVKLTFPKGWRVESENKAIVAYAPGDAAAIQVRTMPIKPDMDPRTFIVQQLGLSDLEDGRDITVAGKPGYIAVAGRAPSIYGPKPVRTAVIFDEKRRRVFVFSGAGKHDLSRIAADREFISTIFSFDDMTARERSLARPVVVKVVKAGDGTTIEWLAQRSALSGYVEEHLRLINDMSDAEEPAPGQLIKVVE